MKFETACWLIFPYSVWDGWPGLPAARYSMYVATKAYTRLWGIVCRSMRPPSPPVAPLVGKVGGWRRLRRGSFRTVLSQPCAGWSDMHLALQRLQLTNTHTRDARQPHPTEVVQWFATFMIVWKWLRWWWGGGRVMSTSYNEEPVHFNGRSYT